MGEDQWLGAMPQTMGKPALDADGDAVGITFVRAMQPCPTCGCRMALVKSEWIPGSTEEYGLAFDFRCRCQV